MTIQWTEYIARVCGQEICERRIPGRTMKPTDLLHTLLVTHVQSSSPPCISYDTSIASSKVSPPYKAI